MRKDLEKAIDEVIGNGDGVLTPVDGLVLAWKVLSLVFAKRGR